MDLLCPASFDKTFGDFFMTAKKCIICYVSFQLWFTTIQYTMINLDPIIIYPTMHMVNQHKTSVFSRPLRNLQLCIRSKHYNDVIISTMAYQIASISVVYSTVCSGWDQRKHQSFVSLAFVKGIHRWPVNSPHNGLITRKMFAFDDVIMNHYIHNTHTIDHTFCELKVWSLYALPI